MANYGVTDASGITEVSAAFGGVYTDVLSLSSQVQALRNEVAALKGGGGVGGVGVGGW